VKVKKLTEKTVEITLEVNSFYTKDPTERTIYDNAYILKEYESKYPKQKVANVLQGCQLDNFTKTGKFTGVWVLELETPPSKPVVKKNKPRKQKAFTK